MLKRGRLRSPDNDLFAALMICAVWLVFLFFSVPKMTVMVRDFVETRVWDGFRPGYTYLLSTFSLSVYICTLMFMLVLAVVVFMNEALSSAWR